MLQMNFVIFMKLKFCDLQYQNLVARGSNPVWVCETGACSSCDRLVTADIVIYVVLSPISCI
jgi:hypothetical protein